MLTAVYPGRFDPVTNGHVDIAQRAASLFKRVVIAIYDLPADKSLFSTEERVQMFTDAVKHLNNIEVRSSRGSSSTSRAASRPASSSAAFERSLTSRPSWTWP